MRKQLLMHARVTGIQDASESLRLIELEPTQRDQFPDYHGGAHVNLRLPDGRMRQYSLCGPGWSRNYRIAVRREDQGRGVSRYLHTELRIGDPFHVSYPQEVFRLSDEATRHRFIAGGVGITPLVGMLYDLATTVGTEDTVLHYFVRDHSDAVFADELRELGVDVHTYPSGQQDRATVLERVIADPGPTECLYVCGPPRLMDNALRLADEAGWQDARHESFAAPASSGEVLGEAFTVHLTLLDKTVEVGERETLLHALQQAGAPVQSSCEGGICGTCVVDLEDGVAIHRDDYLSDEERNTLITTCVSRGMGCLKLKV